MLSSPPPPPCTPTTQFKYPALSFLPGYRNEIMFIRLIVGILSMSIWILFPYRYFHIGHTGSKSINVPGSSRVEHTVRKKPLDLVIQLTMSGKGVLWAIIWFFVLILIAWPIGFFCAGWYVCLSPFEACIDAMKSVTSLLMSGVTFPFHVTHRMVKGQSYSKIWGFETIIDHIK